MEQITIYKFSGLSEEAQEKVLEYYRYKLTDVFGVDEIIGSLKAVFEHCYDVSMKDYSIGSYEYNIKIEFNSDDVAELSGVRAYTWLENNLFKYLRISKAEYLKNRKDYFRYGKSYRIGCIKECPLTGMCYDEDFLDSLKADVLSDYTLKEAFENLAYVASKLIQTEEEFQSSDEYIAEHLEANEYRFLDSGNAI